MYKKVKYVIPVVLFAVFAITHHFGLFSRIDTVIQDNIMVSDREADHNIIIVGIDERSINEIGSWPWPRSFMAEAVEQLTEMGAAVIGIAVLYDNPGAVPEYDQRLIDAAIDADGLVLGGLGIISPIQDSAGLVEIEDYILPFGDLGNNSTVGFLNMMPDEADGVLRRALTSMRFGDITVHSFPFEVYRTYRRVIGQSDYALQIGEIPLDDNGQFPIRYVGGPETFTTRSLWGVINGHYPAAMFQDAIVLIGPYAQGIGDGNFPTPAQRRMATYGVEIYANIIQNLLEGEFVTNAGQWLDIAILLFCALIVFALFVYAKPLVAFIALVAMLTMLFASAWFVYNQFYIIMNVSNAIIFIAVCFIAHIALSIFTAQNDKAAIKELFGRFVAPEVVNQIIMGGLDIQLGGVVKEVTALFVDIRGFTAFSEAHPPEKVVSMVNRYLELTSTAIQKNSGTIDKFIGDATMALFNAPNNVPNHALCAVEAAWAMKKGATALKQQIMDDYGVDLQFGIGINTGAAVVGNMGSDFRMDYTAIGDAINTAARLESNAEKGQIIISDATYQQVKEHVKVTELGTIALKNKSVGVLIYSVDSVGGEELP